MASMWFPLSLLALLMLVLRRSTEKQLASNINSMAMTWLQQAMAIPFIIGTLFFAKFYLPGELSAQFWQLLAVYVVLSSLDLFLYFKAISMADISHVAPLMTLFAVGNLIGAYLVLGQVPTIYGVFGAILIMAGAYLVSVAKSRDKLRAKANRTVLLLVLAAVVLRSYYSNIEVIMLRESNPTSYNFYTSILTIPFVLLISWIIVRQRPGKYEKYWTNVRSGVKRYFWPLLIIGITYTVNMLATYEAKVISPNAAYVGAVKSAAVLPIVLIGILFFKEKVVRLQWVGLGLIVLGLAALAVNI
jgi:transporter family protein